MHSISQRDGSAPFGVRRRRDHQRAIDDGDARLAARRESQCFQPLATQAQGGNALALPVAVHQYVVAGVANGALRGLVRTRRALGRQFVFRQDRMEQRGVRQVAERDARHRGGDERRGGLRRGIAEAATGGRVARGCGCFAGHTGLLWQGIPLSPTPIGVADGARLAYRPKVRRARRLPRTARRKSASIRAVDAANKRAPDIGGWALVAPLGTGHQSRLRDLTQRLNLAIRQSRCQRRFVDRIAGYAPIEIPIRPRYYIF